jgi:hypothetical protein
MALVAASAMAAPPQSDDFKNGLGSFWKAKQVSNGTAFPAPTYKVENGKLYLTSADDDIWTTTFEPYILYQEVSGDFTAQMKVQSIPQCNEWSHIGLLAAADLPDSYSDSTTIPTWFLVAAGRSHGTESKGGGQGQSTNSTGTETQPPYWIRMDRKDGVFTIYNSLDGGKTWNQAYPDFAPLDAVEPMPDNILFGISEQTHCGQTLGTAVVSNFEAGTIDMAGKLPGDAATPSKLSGAVKDASGSAVTTGTVITATDAGGNIFNALTDADGNYSMTLDPGTYKVSGPADFEVTGNSSVTIASGTDSSLDLTLKPQFISIASVSIGASECVRRVG